MVTCLATSLYSQFLLVIALLTIALNSLDFDEIDVQSGIALFWLLKQVNSPMVASLNFDEISTLDSFKIGYNVIHGNIT